MAIEVEETFRNVLLAEGRALLSLDLDMAQVAAAISLIVEERYLTFVTGVGKSGLIAAKIAATMSSLGIPAVFLDPTDAAHGDLGIVRPNSTVIALSNSGNSLELANVLPSLKARGAQIIAIVGDPQSRLAAAAASVISFGRLAEADVMGLAPTTTTTIQLAIGDALAVAAAAARGVSPEEFLENHPAGTLGRNLSRVKQLMRVNDEVPRIGFDATFVMAVEAITSKRIGLACVVDDEGALLGIVTDGDIRRALQIDADPRTLGVRDIMRSDPETVSPDERIGDVLAHRGLTRHLALPVVSEAGGLLGVLVALDLLT